MERKANGEEEIAAQWADAPGNPQLIQVFMAESGLGQPEQQPGQEGEDPNAQADVQQQQADDAHEKGKENSDDAHEKAKETSDDDHDKQLEVMDKEHDQAKEMEQLKHKNSLQLEKVKAANKPKPKPPGSKAPLKKSLTSEDEVVIELDWSKY
jgi:hypothetical protein